MSAFRRTRLRVLGAGWLALTLIMAGCGSGGGGSSSSSGGPIVIGADLPMTGSLARFGTLMKLAYQTEINQVNQVGGVDVGGQKRKVKLVILDDGSDPQKASSNTSTLVLKDGAVGLLGTATPPVVIPQAQVAERQQVPLVSPICPLRACLSAAPSGGYKSSWFFFFDEAQMTNTQYKVMDMDKSNHKVALFTDQEQDGQVMGGLWAKNAPGDGYQVVYHATFPVGTTDFSTFIRKAQASGAQVMISQMIPPDAITLWKQMKSLGWKPKAAFMEKSANTAAWYQGLGPDVKGVMVSSWWSDTLGYPQTQFAVRTFGKAAQGNVEIAQCVNAYTAAQILTDAIARAGSTDPAKINQAIGRTNKTYVAGHIQFSSQHISVQPTIMLQWQGNGQTLPIYPADKSGGNKMIYPLPPWK